MKDKCISTKKKWCLYFNSNMSSNNIQSWWISTINFDWHVCITANVTQWIHLSQIQGPNPIAKTEIRDIRQPWAKATKRKISYVPSQEPPIPCNCFVVHLFTGNKSFSKSVKPCDKLSLSLICSGNNYVVHLAFMHLNRFLNLEIKPSSPWKVCRSNNSWALQDNLWNTQANAPNGVLALKSAMIYTPMELKIIQAEQTLGHLLQKVSLCGYNRDFLWLNVFVIDTSRLISIQQGAMF